MRRFLPYFTVFAAIAASAVVIGCAGGPDAPDKPAGLSGHGSGSIDPADLDPSSSLPAFLAKYNFENEEDWVHFDVQPSAITSTKRRIFFQKVKVAAALLTYAGGEGDESSAMEYPRGSVFIAQALDANDHPLDTEILFTNAGEMPTFLVFDHNGLPTNVFIRPVGDPNGRRANVPRACINCHSRRRGFHPTYSFPNEKTEHKMLMPVEWRDARAVAYFQESKRRGETLFGPYGAILIGKLSSEAAAGTLSEEDEVLWEAISERFPQLTGPDTPSAAELTAKLDGNRPSD